MLIIGVTGTLGAGKGTVVDYLIGKNRFKHFSVRELLVKEIEKRGLPVNRESMVIVGNDLRQKHSPSYLAEELFKKAEGSNKNCVIESLRTPGEIASLRKIGKFYLFAVDADPKKRYQRIRKRGSATDKVSFEEFLANEKREMVSDDPNKQNLSGCIELADYKFDNNGTIDFLHARVKKALNEIKKREK